MMPIHAARSGWPHCARLASSLVVAGLPACLVPPCPCVAVTATAPDSVALARDAASLPAGAVRGQELASAGGWLIWNGESADERGSGWASCQDERSGACQTSLAAEAGAGRGGSAGLHFNARGAEWMGFGWNWYGWWPQDAGTDISQRKSLAFAVKVVGKPGKAPEPFTVKIALGGSALGGQDSTEAIPLVDYAPDFADGKWHDVTLPIGAMLRGKGARFDTQHTWSFVIGAWNQGEREYEIFIDDVRFM